MKEFTKYDMENSVSNPWTVVEFTVPEGVTTIGDRAFEGCKRLMSIDLPKSVTAIGKRAFEGCESLASIALPEGVTEIGDYAFFQCRSLTNITLPESVTTIGTMAFCSCKSLASIALPEGVTEISDFLFSGCTCIENIMLPESVTAIGEWAFQDCRSLTSITLPESVTTIDKRAFEGCRSLTNIILSGTTLKVDLKNIIERSEELKICAPHIGIESFPLGKIQDRAAMGYIQLIAEKQPVDEKVKTGYEKYIKEHEAVRAFLMKKTSEAQNAAAMGKKKKYRVYIDMHGYLDVDAKSSEIAEIIASGFELDDFVWVQQDVRVTEEQN